MPVMIHKMSAATHHRTDGRCAGPLARRQNRTRLRSTRGGRLVGSAGTDGEQPDRQPGGVRREALVRAEPKMIRRAQRALDALDEQRRGRIDRIDRIGELIAAPEGQD